MEQTIFADTIFALSSGALPSGVAMIRVSGHEVRHALERLCGSIPVARRAELRNIRSANGEIIDTGFVLFLAGPKSFTGEDVAELHVHGGRGVVAAILRELGTLNGLRQAEAGEFTRRAFLNGKMDLTGAEALADLVASETEAQRRFAQANAVGQQGVLYREWRRRILQARAMVEAELDFADEADVGEAPSSGAWPDMRRLVEEIEAHLASYHRAEIIREGFQVVIVGAPNAGKSSLLNALASREVAIVTEEAGTTRDLIEVPLDLGGVKVLVTDTAGLRQEAGRVEVVGIERARARAAEADLLLLLTDLSDPIPVAERFGNVPIRTIGTKADLVHEPPVSSYDHVISVYTGSGLDYLIAALTATAKKAASTTGVLPSRLRHVELLSRCKGLLAEALDDRSLELQAEELRLAGDALGRIVGSVDVEELLGAIFSNFCIGK
ncbi:MAG: tRNA uridine-5-carboxymethylaminomethyl(34) synthesis GTPase MnmE [Rhizobiales bacterium]|nr:tRNA uridine-5-carboxymethylaminomethyl(34) synthesis GTPase MnmE [Hyphomicrobiales bacterium]